MTIKVQICGSLLLLSLFGHMAGMSFFPHTHIVDGGTITHSHPYSGTSQNPGHGHSVSQFALIALLNMALMAAASVRLSTILTACKPELLSAAPEKTRYHSEFGRDPLRGPPAAT